MPVNIRGTQYVTVAERVKELHTAKAEHLSVETEVLAHEPVVIKATVTIDGNSFTGISAANPSKQIEKMSPYEVAETSAVGRALGFAGFGSVDSIASADEMNKGGYDSTAKTAQIQATRPPVRLSAAQLAQIAELLKSSVYGSLAAFESQTGFTVATMPPSKAVELIGKLTKAKAEQESQTVSADEDDAIMNGGAR